MRNRIFSVILFCYAAGYASASVNITSTGTISIPSGTGQVSSSVTASGLTGSIQTVTVTLNNWSEPGPNYGEADREFMVVYTPSSGPAQTFEFLGGFGNNNCSLSNLSLTFADGSTNPYAPDNYGYNGGTCAPSGRSGDNAPSSGATLRPTVNYGGSEYCSADVSGAQFVPPAPTSASCATDNSNSPSGSESSGGTATFGSQFSGTGNGTWTLYIRTGSLGSEDSSATLGSWTLSITTKVASTTSTSLSSNATNNETTIASSVTLTASVTSSGGTVSEGTVAFTDNGNTISGCGSQPVSGGTATCVTSFSIEGNHPLEAAYTGGADFGNSSSTTYNLFVDHATTTTSTPGQYCNTGTITINTASSPGTTPYPQHITIPAQTGTLSDVSLYLPNINLPDFEYLELLLVDPNGNKFIPLAGTGGQKSGTVTWTLSDFASGQTPVPNPAESVAPSGTYLPTDDSSVSFPASPDGPPLAPYRMPATEGGATFDTTFDGTNPEGQWSLYVFYNSGDSTGSMGGYCLTITTSAAAATTTTVSSSPNGEASTGQQVTFTATVTQTSGGSPVSSGTVTFKENGNVLSGPTTVNGSGQATFQSSSLSEGIHNIEALYSGVAGTYAVSSGTVSIEIDTPTTNPSAGLYCNPGGMSISGSNGGTNIPASPYPSRINVSSLAGTVNTVAVQLNNFSDAEPYGSSFLLTGPTGTNIVFYNDSGSEDAGFSGLNLNITDSASSQLPADPNNPSSGSYKPASYTGLSAPVFPAPAPATNNYAAPEGTQTLTSAFQNINGNGYWSLYEYDRFGDAAVGINNWCLNVVNNPPVVTLAKVHNGTFTQGDSADTYTITVANPSGPGSTAGTMTLTDTLPTGMSAVSISQTGGGTGSDWTCTTSPTLGCTRTTAMAPGESDTITLTVSVSYNTSTATNGAVNNVSLSGGGISGAPVTAQDTQTVQVGPGYALNLSVNPSGGGTVSNNPTNTAGLTAGHYAPGATVTLNATPTQTATMGYAFSSWTGSPDISNASASTTTITMNSATENVTANFTVAYQQVSGISVSQTGWTYNRFSKQGTATVTVQNTSGQTLSGPIQIALSGLPAGVTAVNNTGTFNGNPYWTVTAGSLAPGASAQVSISLAYASGTNFTVNYSVYSGNL